MRILSNNTSKQLLCTYVKERQINKLFQNDFTHYMQLVEFNKKEFVFHQGEEIKGLYFLLDGKMKVSHLLSNGSEVITAMGDKHTIFGEIELMLDCPAISSVAAVTNALCIFLPFHQCREQLLSDLVFLKYMGSHLARIILNQTNNHSINLNYTLEARVASYILSAQKDEVFTCDLKTLPNILGVSYRHFHRILGHFQKINLIEKEDNYYIILDHETLQEISGDLLDLYYFD